MGNCASPASSAFTPYSVDDAAAKQKDAEERARELEFIMARDTSRSISPVHFESSSGDGRSREEDKELKNRWYVLDRIWLNSWLNYCTTGENGPRPGPVDNSSLLVVDENEEDEEEEDKKDDCTPRQKKRLLKIKDGLVMDKEDEPGHYRVVKAGVWEAFMSLYGGGPEIWVEGEMFEVEDLTKWVFDQGGGEEEDNRGSLRHVESVVIGLDDLQVDRLESIGIRDTQFELLKERTRQASIDSMSMESSTVRTETEVIKVKGILGTVLQAEKGLAGKSDGDTGSTEETRSGNNMKAPPLEVDTLGEQEMLEDEGEGDLDDDVSSQKISLPPSGPSTPPRHDGPSTAAKSQPLNVQSKQNYETPRSRTTSNESFGSTPSSIMFSKLGNVGNSAKNITGSLGSSVASSFGTTTQVISRNVRQLSVDTDEGEEEFMKKRMNENLNGQGMKRQSVAWLFDSDDE
ncbi:hypothetical protein TrVE_jg10270 [Triparma verrucosa]|uniref:DUSP domain-containing protein n=1 Tax=Triparma verrucosa TaxID=1606542 RepID=A0A9W7F359_9STRA|nr:hypothetical protein TrVE_jg10270 [Triparma verrucosa]